MAELRLVIAGAGAEAAADTLAAIAGEGEAVEIARQPTATLPDSERKAVDLIALAALVLSIPPAVLAVADLVQRMRKRKKAQALIEEAHRLRIERRVEVSVLTIDGVPRDLAGLDADALLAIAEAVRKAP